MNNAQNLLTAVKSLPAAQQEAIAAQVDLGYSIRAIGNTKSGDLVVLYMNAMAPALNLRLTIEYADNGVELTRY